SALFGFAAGTKYLALFPILLTGLFLLYFSAKEKSLWPIAAFAILVIAIAGPWYIRNAYYTGNPIWPYWASKLGYGPWTPEDTAGQFWEQLSHGAGKNISAFFLLPWNL